MNQTISITQQVTATNAGSYDIVVVGGGIAGCALDTVTNCRNDGIVIGSDLTGAIAGSCDEIELSVCIDSENCNDIVVGCLKLVSECTSSIYLHIIKICCNETNISDLLCGGEKSVKLGCSELGVECVDLAFCRVKLLTNRSRSLCDVRGVLSLELLDGLEVLLGASVKNNFEMIF